MDTEMVEDGSTLLFESIEKLINYYFSDFNLNRDKFLRANLSENTNGITVDCLLMFKRLNSIVQGDRKLLIDFLQKWQSNLVEFVPETECIRRKVDCPFVYDKNYLKNNCDQILYVSKLPEGTCLEDIERWTLNFEPHVSIQGIKRVKDNSIRSALIVFSNSETVTSIIEQKETILFKSLISTKETNIQLMFYRDYMKLKNKIRKKCRTKRSIINDFANLSVSDQSGTSFNTTTSTIGSKAPLGMASLVAKRTLLLKCEDDCPLTMRIIKLILEEHGLLYIYQTSLTEKHFCLFFKNRALFSRFFERLQNNPKFVFQNAETNVSIDSDRFTLVDLNKLPACFRHYLKCVKLFFSNKNKKVDNNNNNNNENIENITDA